MADILLFIHGTGVRQKGYDQSIALLKKGFENHPNIDVEIDGVCWGPKFGVNVDENAIEEVLPPARARGAEIGTNEIGFRAALWAELLRDPLIELRLASMRPPAQAKQNPALPGVRTPDVALTTMLTEFNRKVGDPLPGEVDAEAIKRATLWLIGQPILISAAAATGNTADGDLLQAVARAIVAKTLIGYRGEMGVGPSALYVADERDQLVDAILTSFPEARSVGSWLWDGVKSLATNAATYYGRERRSRLMDGVSLGIGDILLYERRGDEILAMIEAKILEIAAEKKRVVVLGHSLGGIMMVDLLSRPRAEGALPVTMLITVGSQAPVLFKFDALDTMRLKQALPEGAPYRPWLNIYDRNDFLSFCASRSFPGVTAGIEDIEVESDVSFPEAHSAYFRQPSFFAKIAHSWPKIES